jgi:hypothetical protein
MQDAETVLDVLHERGRDRSQRGHIIHARPPCHAHGINHWRAVMRGNPHVRFGPEVAGKGPAPRQAPRRRPTGTSLGCRFRAGVHKICAYFPYPIKVWLNGHEWAKRQATGAGIGFTELSNGFGSCADPAALQAICDRLGPGTIGVFFERWMSRLPLPLTEHDRAAGYWWELSMRQVEVSRTLVFDAPRHARGSSRHWSPTTSTSAARS